MNGEKSCDKMKKIAKSVAMEQGGAYCDGGGGHGPGSQSDGTGTNASKGQVKPPKSAK